MLKRKIDQLYETIKQKKNRKVELQKQVDEINKKRKQLQFEIEKINDAQNEIYGEIVNYEKELKYFDQLQVFAQILYNYNIIEDIAKLIFDYMIIEEIYIYNDDDNVRDDREYLYNGKNFVNCNDYLEIKDTIITEWTSRYNYSISIEYRLPFLNSSKQQYYETFRCEYYIMNSENKNVWHINNPIRDQHILKNLQDSHAIIFQTNKDNTAITYLYINKKFFK